MDQPDTRAILFVGSQMAVGGSQMVLLQLAGWFHARGYRVVVAFFYDRDGAGWNLAGALSFSFD